MMVVACYKHVAAVDCTLAVNSLVPPSSYRTLDWLGAFVLTHHIQLAVVAAVSSAFDLVVADHTAVFVVVVVARP